MPRDRSGYVFRDKDGKWYARVTLTDVTGKRRNVKRRAKDRVEARQFLKELVRQLDAEGERAIDAASRTFADLADYYEQTYLHPAEYVHERKVSGLRAPERAQIGLKLFRSHFGNMNLRSLTYGDIYAYRNMRLKTKTQYGTPRTIAAMNRELGILRRILNVGVQQAWLLRNPFNAGSPLISADDENKRDRVLSQDEESRLFAAIDTEPKREHLRGILLVALDCALRRGEMFKLRWSDVNLERRTISVRSMNCKTARSRVVAMTNRVHTELQGLSLKQRVNNDETVFGVHVTVRTSFGKACKAAQIEGFHLHDCRHTAITRMIRAGLPPVEVMRVSGHSTLSCLYRYANLDSDAVFRAAAALDAYHAETMEPKVASESQLVN
jgi:integrase